MRYMKKNFSRVPFRIHNDSHCFLGISTSVKDQVEASSGGLPTSLTVTNNSIIIGIYVVALLWDLLTAE